MADVRIKMEREDEENRNKPIEVPDDDDICELEHLRKLFVGGLAPYTTEEGLKTFYDQWGKVVDVVVMRDPNSKRSRGFGFITYTKSSMVDKAQEHRPHIIDGKTVEAKRALPRPERESRESNISVKKLFVGGLKDNHDEDCLKEYFAQFGNVISVKLLTDKTTGKRRGFAFVEFDDYDAVDKAILQKQHSIKYVLVDVKKSIYKLEKKDKMFPMTKQGTMSNNLNQIKPPPNAPGQPMGGYRPPMPPQQSMPAYPHNSPPTPMSAPPPNYNYWGPPPPMPQPYYQQPPPQMNGWSYPPAQNGWNTAANGAQQWQPNQWGGPPPVAQPQGPPSGPPPARGPPMSAPPAAGNWNMPQTAQAQPIPGPPGAGGNNNMNSQPPPQQPPQQLQQPPPVPPQQQQQQANFGNGYQQNYGGGPTKHNMNSNRMNPYNAPPNYTNNGHASAYANYNSGMGNAIAPVPVPKPVTNGASAVAAKYRR